MNDRSVKPKQAVAAKEKGRPRSGEYARTSNMDDEFHEFFNQGDVGEYEGGVAYSQPPSRLLPEPEVDEQIVITDPSRQRARRAFFGRVVAIIVGACVVVLPPPGLGLKTSERITRTTRGTPRFNLRRPRK